MRFSQATVFACLCALAPTATLRAWDDQEWNAEFVKMDVPTTVRANQAFAVAITMKNTGTKTWQFVSGADNSTHLRSIAPYSNFTWGTNFIIQGQGTVVEPGQEFTYKSNLRAPNMQGKHVFRWRLHGPQGDPFGEPTSRVLITVGEPLANKPPTPMPKPDGTGKRPLTFDDFRYLGSFRLPHTIGDARGAFSESGICLRKYPDGTERLLVNYTHPTGALFEVNIPEVNELKKYKDGDASELPKTEAKIVWGALAQNEVGANGGIYWDEDKKTLYWTYYHGYWTGGDLPILQATKLNDDGTVTPAGSWTAPQQKWHWGGVTRLPKSFADRYTEGKTMALGFGGYYSICAPCSRGPTLSVIADPDPAASGVQGLVNLLGYPESTPAPRPGNYFNANCGFWNKPPRTRAEGTWTYDDYIRGGVMIDLEDKQGYITFARLGTGRLGYDYGSITSGGAAQYWYFYDTRHLGQAARGDRKPNEVLPYQVRIDRGMGGWATGVCFDESRRRLYLIRSWCYPDGRESYPLVHVYHVKKN